MIATAPLDNSIQRAAWCAAVAEINTAHLAFWCEHCKYDYKPYDKLSQKLSSYLRGELKSLANLERFHETFAEWRADLPRDDNLAYRIAEFCCSALYCGVESILDPECDDIDLLRGNIQDLYTEMSYLSDEVDLLKDYYQDIERALTEVLPNISQPPVDRALFDLTKQIDTSLFGL